MKTGVYADTGRIDDTVVEWSDVTGDDTLGMLDGSAALRAFQPEAGNDTIEGTYVAQP
jgi:hypothetical protein